MKSPKLLLLLTLVFAASTVSASDILPLSAVKKGMKGYGLTVFQGNQIEKFDVEITGVLHNIGPNQNMILARVDHDVLKQSGIIAGMSGSPIYVDGKVIGALAFGWQFAKDSIAGIQPIEDMLRLSNITTSGAPRLGPQLPAAQFLKQMADRDGTAMLEQLSTSVFANRGTYAAAMPIATPLSMSGFSNDTLQRFSPTLERGGFLAVPTGRMNATSSGSNPAASSAPFRPGDAVAAMLIDGDFSVAATGTVTHIDGEKVYGFGHPFLDMGEVEFPMATAEVVGVMPSLASSFKFANSGGIVGAFKQDRSAGILGFTGAKAKMIPVELTLDGARGQEHYKFRVARNAQLFPLLLAMVSDSVVSSAQRAAGERTLSMDLELDIAGHEAVKLSEGWSGLQARQSMPAYLALVAGYILSNEFTDAQIEGVKLRLRHDDQLRVAKLMEASLETPADGEFNPGDKVKVHTLLKPFRGEDFRKTFEITIPSDIKPGNTYLMIGSGTLSNQLSFAIAPPDPRSLGSVLNVVRRLRSSTELTANLFADTNGVVAGGAYQPNLPPSISAVMVADSSNSLQAPVRYDAVQQVGEAVGYVVDGAVRLDLPVRPRI